MRDTSVKLPSRSREGAGYIRVILYGHGSVSFFGFSKQALILASSRIVRIFLQQSNQLQHIFRTRHRPGKFLTAYRMR